VHGVFLAAPISDPRHVLLLLKNSSTLPALQRSRLPMYIHGTSLMPIASAFAFVRSTDDTETPSRSASCLVVIHFADVAMFVSSRNGGMGPSVTASDSFVVPVAEAPFWA
jgi:hypothetical protein